jgi:hypothetical protein
MFKVHSYAFSKTSRLLALSRPQNDNTVSFDISCPVRLSDEVILSFSVATQLSPLYIKWETQQQKVI